MCIQDQQSCEGEEFLITMAIGQKTRSGEGFWHGDYHVNGPNTLLRMISFLNGDYHDYHGNWTENWERGRFLPWWLPWQWAKHGFEVDGFLPWWLPWQWDRKLGAGKVFAMVITMAVGKTRFWLMGFCHGDYHGSGTENWERRRFLPWYYHGSGAENWERRRFLPWYYHGSGQHTVLRLIGFCHGDYHGSGTENSEGTRFLPWWNHGKWARHAFEVFAMVIPWQMDPCQPKIITLACPLKKRFQKSKFEIRFQEFQDFKKSGYQKISRILRILKNLEEMLAAKPRVFLHARPLRGSADWIYYIHDFLRIYWIH